MRIERPHIDGPRVAFANFPGKTGQLKPKEPRETPSSQCKYTFLKALCVLLFFKAKWRFFLFSPLLSSSSSFVVNSVFSTREQRCLRLKDGNPRRPMEPVCVGCLIDSSLCLSALLRSAKPVKLAIGAKKKKTTCIEALDEREGRTKKTNEWRWKDSVLEERKGERFFFFLRPPPKEMRRQAEEGGECVEEAVCERQSSSACQTSVIDHKPTQPSLC